VTLRARWVTLRARWVTLRARWATLRARWVTLRARWVSFQVRILSDSSAAGWAAEYRITLRDHVLPFAEYAPPMLPFIKKESSSFVSGF
jgi:hypothetical protein